MMIRRKIKGAVKKVNRDLLCVLFFYRELTCFLICPTIDVFSHCSLHAKQ